MLARAGSFSAAANPLLQRQQTTDAGSHSLPRQASSARQQQQQQQPVARQSSGGSSGSGGSTGNGVLRQGSQGSLFEQIANQAKDLVRETTRQSSQDGILAHMDKV